MPNSVFVINQPKPTNEQLECALGQALELWNNFNDFVKHTYAGIESDWKIYGKMTGWQLVFSHNGEKILHLTPGKDTFSVWFPLDESDVKKVKKSGLPRVIRETVRTITPHYNTWAHSYIITNANELEHIIELYKIKFASE